MKSLINEGKIISFALGVLFSQAMYRYTEFLFLSLVSSIKIKMPPFLLESLRLLFVVVIITGLYLLSQVIITDEFRQIKASLDITKDLEIKSKIKKTIANNSFIKRHIHEKIAEDKTAEDKMLLTNKEQKNLDDLIIDKTNSSNKI